MRILIIGAGAMGSLFAAMLAPHADVRLLTSNQDHENAINKHGLQIYGLDGQLRQIKVQLASDTVQDHQSADLVLICTKAGATAKAAQAARRYLTPHGLALTLQNGLGNRETIATQVGEMRTMAGTTAQAATLLAPGQVRHAGSGMTYLGLHKAQKAGVAQIAALFNRAGIACEQSEHIDRLIWSKLIVNVGINALAAILRVPNGVLANIPECGRLMEAAVAEAVAVAQALALDFALSEQIQKVRQVCAETSANHASMLQDVVRGKTTEVDVINGAIVAKGKEVGVATPVNALLTQIIKALEATVAYRI